MQTKSTKIDMITKIRLYNRVHIVSVINWWCVKNIERNDIITEDNNRRLSSWLTNEENSSVNESTAICRIHQIPTNAWFQWSILMEVMNSISSHQTKDVTKSIVNRLIKTANFREHSIFILIVLLSTTLIFHWYRIDCSCRRKKRTHRRTWPVAGRILFKLKIHFSGKQEHRLSKP